MSRRAIVLLTALCLAFAVNGYDSKAASAQEDVQEGYAAAADRMDTGLSSDIARNEAHEDITWDLITLVEHDAELKELLEKAILQAREENPDPDTNPVVSLETYYQFIDRIVRAMPWEISPYGSYSSLYTRIDQGMGCLYFVCDQPLEELADKEYYHNSLLYHEPFRSWWIKLLSVNGSFLSSEESWNDAYYQTAYENPDFDLQGDTYEDPSNWKSFNDFFARRLKDASVRPVSEPDNAAIVTSPADSVPQGIWQIDKEGRIETNIEEQAGISIKTGRLTNINALLADSEYAEKFYGGTITHTFLDITDYHRYHFPVSGTVREVRIIAQDDAPGGVITWDEERGCYYEYYSETLGWQAIETRGIVIVELTGGGYAAIIPVGMCQVSSVNFEDTVAVGASVKKGDPLGYFLFGGSDIIMIFSPEAGFELTAEPGGHILMGTEYGRNGVRPENESEPVVWFTSDISPEGLVAVYEKLGWDPEGKTAVKISTGEPPASNYLRPELIADLVHEVDGTIVECNTAYGGSRASSAMHHQVAEDHGFTAIADFDLMDEEGEMEIPVSLPEGMTAHFSDDVVGSHFAGYDSFLILSHFKGHSMAGFGGAIKNTSIGIASSRGKARIHSGGRSDKNPWGGDQTAFTESMAEAAKAVSDCLGEGQHIAYINVMNRLSVDCDCDGNPAEPDIHDIGILACTDPVALDQACVDLVYLAENNESLVRRIESRDGIHTLERAEEIGLGSRAYKLVDIDE